MSVEVAVAVAVAVILLASQSRDARAADAADVESVAKMNRKALEEYDDLNFDGARKTLEAALEACQQDGLERHPVAADAHLLLGAVILAGGAAARADAVAELRKALEIRPGVKLPERIVNPEIEAALDQAAAAVRAAGAPVTATERSAGATDAAENGDADADADADADEEEEDVDAKAGKKKPADAAPSWLIGFGVGSGLGWTSGTGEVTDGKVESGFRPAAVVHILPEVGYFVKTNLLLSIQLRVQFVAGATAERDPTMTICGSDHICSPGTGATAVLARATWFLGDGTFRPYLSGAIGGGQLRHVASVPGRADCGTDPARPVGCVDTVDSGPVFVGPGAGLSVTIARGLALSIGLGTLFGFPHFTFNADINGGVAVEL
jgi:hypothetical protein